MVSKKDAVYSFDELTDEEIDEKYKLRNSNQRKSIAPAYAYLVLKKETDNEHHMTQAELARKLAEEPIGLKLNRKSISRIVYALADSGIGIEASTQEGVWYSGDVWFDEFIA